MKNKSSTVILLLGLTIADILIILNAGVNAIMFASSVYGIPFTREQKLLSTPYFATFISSIPAKIGNFLTLLVSLERMFCVLMPMKIRQYSTKKTAFIATIFSYVLAVAFALPFMFLYTTDKIYSNTTGQYITIIQPTEFAMNVELADALYITGEIIVKFIPVLGVAFSSAITAVLVVVNARRRSTIAEMHSKSKSSTKENQVTRTLLVITFVYLFCQMPDTILRMIVFVDPEMTPYRYKNNTFEIGQTSTYIILLINSVVNFVIYFKTSSAYRAKFKTMLGCQISESNQETVFTVKNITTSTKCSE